MATTQNKTYHIQTFGCQMNEHDSEKIEGILIELGYSSCINKKDADIFIINTCSVRENADNRFFGTLGQLKKIKEQRKNVIIAVCGCMMQQQHIVDKIKSKYSWVDLVFGTHNIGQLPTLINNVLNEKIKIVSILPDADEITEGLPVKRLYKHKALVNIMYGCNNFCTYCIVPYARGREKSRMPGAIIDEVKALAANGTKEIFLLGQNVNSYGNNCDFDFDFTDLIYELDSINGIERIRFMTSHPKDISDKLINAYKDCATLKNYIHLPVQSGSNIVLKSMNRGYTKESYLEIINKLKIASEGVAITTDIIVGFPRETEDDFCETLDLIEKARFDSAFTFIYSPRKGTPAENFKDQISEDIKHKRFSKLVDVLNEITVQKNAQMLGKIATVLVEGYSKTDKKFLTGRTEENKIVNFPGNEHLIGNMINVKITEAKTFSLVGKLV